MALLHSFWYEAAESAFRQIAERDPKCAMAHWGRAMTAFYPLWPVPPDYARGREAIERARSIGGGNDKENGFIEATANIFLGSEPPNLLERKKRFEKALEALHERYPEDPEVAIFYALALTSTAPPEDKTYGHQRQAADILTALAPSMPEHPGILHYTIHAYDTPELAERALDVAGRYSEVASSVPHGLHMSSHIFTRLGLWKESVATNGGAVAAGHRFAFELGAPGAWDEELHAFEYLEYALLQLAEDSEAEKVLHELRTHTTATPANMKAAHSFAAVPARYVLERHAWMEARALEPFPSDFPWERFPFPSALTPFTRAIGFARTGAPDEAARYVNELARLRDSTEDGYWSRQIEVLRLEAAAWVAHASGRTPEAQQWLEAAVALEESMEKHAVTPGPLIPAREQLAELLLETSRPQEALAEFQKALVAAPNRFHALYGAGSAANRAGDLRGAQRYFTTLAEICEGTESTRPELLEARRAVK